MLAGMVPMALGIGEGGEQVAPLGRAVIGGLLGGDVGHPRGPAVRVRRRASQEQHTSVSLDPSDPESRFFVRGKFHANGSPNGETEVVEAPEAAAL